VRSQHLAGGNAAVYAFDIRDEDAVRSAVAAILNEHSHIDGLVNNAGGQFPMLAEAIGRKGGSPCSPPI
jgi:citronellol/citronellal dehydrogenase